MPQAKKKKKKLEVDIEKDVMLFGERSAIQQMLSVLKETVLEFGI